MPPKITRLSTPISTLYRAFPYEGGEAPDELRTRLAGVRVALNTAGFPVLHIPSPDGNGTLTAQPGDVVLVRELTGAATVIPGDAFRALFRTVQVETLAFEETTWHVAGPESRPQYASDDSPPVGPGIPR